MEIKHIVFQLQYQTGVSVHFHILAAVVEKDPPLVIVQGARHGGCKKSYCARSWILVVQVMASEPADVCILLPASRYVEYYASCLLYCTRFQASTMV